MKKIIIFVVVSFLILGPTAHARHNRKGDFVKDMNILFLKEDYAGLIKKAESNLNKRRLTRQEKKEVLYLMGLSQVKLNNFGGAREVFNDILRMKGDEFREGAYIGIADSYFQEGNYKKAIKAYESIIDMYPRSDRLSSIYYNLGLSYKAEKNVAKANFCFGRIKEEYKTSFESGKVAYLPTGKKTEYYIIQLGAFKSLRNAKKLVRRLSRKRYDSYIQKIEKDGKVFYRVRGGKFLNKYYAMRLLRKLKRDRFQAKIIVE